MRLLEGYNFRLAWDDKVLEFEREKTFAIPVKRFHCDQVTDLNAGS